MLNRVPGALPIHLFRHSCYKMYHLAIINFVTDRQTDRRQYHANGRPCSVAVQSAETNVEIVGKVYLDVLDSHCFFISILIAISASAQGRRSWGSTGQLTPTFGSGVSCTILTANYLQKPLCLTNSGSRILEQTGPAAGPKVVW